MGRVVTMQYGKASERDFGKRGQCRSDSQCRSDNGQAHGALARFCLPVAAGLILLLGGCAASTPYQPVSASNRVSGGYSEVRLAPDRFRVTFAGNSFTTRDKVEGSLLYRAAELTAQQGYGWFVVLERETEHQVERRIEPDPSYDPAYGYWQPQWRFYEPREGWHNWRPGRGDPFWTNRVDVTTVEQFEVTAEIRMGNGRMPNRRRAFDAKDVIEKLGPTIERPQP